MCSSDLEIPAEPRPMPAQALKGLVKAREPFAPVARLADVRAPLTDIDDSAQDTDFDTGDGLTSADIDVPVRQEALPLGAAVTAPVIAARSNEVTSSASENSGSQDDVTIGNIPNRKNISSDKTKLVVSTSPDNAPVNAVNADAALPSGPRDTVASAGRASVPDLPRSASSNSRPVAEMPAKSGEHIMPASPEADMAEVPAIPARERATAPAAAVAAAATPVVQPELAGKPVASAASVRTSRPQQTPAMAIEPSRSGVTQPRAELPNPVAVDVEAVEPSERSDGPVKIMTPAAAPEAGRPAAKQSGIAVRDPAPAPATIKSKREAKLDFEPADLPVHAGQSIPVQPQPVEASVHEAVEIGRAHV